MSPTRDRTVSDKIGDWNTAYNAVRDEITLPQIRQVVTTLTQVPADIELGAYVQVLNSAMALARMVAANDRAAGIIAAMLTQSGVTRPVITTPDDSE